MQIQLSRIAPALNATDFLSHISRSKPLDYALSEWFDRNCGVRLQNQNLQVIGSETGLMSADKIIHQLNLAIESDQPAVVHYDPGVLDAENPSFWQSIIGFHVSLILARAEANNGTFYLLRNSWGDDCRIYSDNIAVRCDRGHIWLTAGEVRKYVTSVAYFKSVEP